MPRVLVPLRIETPPKRFASIGRCIFCGVFGKLTEEHLVPSGLAQDSFYMPRATCRTCQDAIHTYETFCMRTMWWPFRTHLGISRGRPETLNLRTGYATTLPDGSTRIDDLSITKLGPDAFPMSFGTVHFHERPGALVGRDPAAPAVHEIWGRHDSRMMDRAMNHLPDNSAVEITRVNLAAVARMVAKIAHGYAVAELGFDAFEHTLVPCIRLEEPPLLHWIGGTREVPAPTPNLHSIRWRIECTNRPYVVVDLRLFCFIGTPVFEIVAGEFKGRLDQLPFLEQPHRTIDVEQPPPIGEPIPAGREIIETGV